MSNALLQENFIKSKTDNITVSVIVPTHKPYM